MPDRQLIHDFDMTLIASLNNLVCLILILQSRVVIGLLTEHNTLRRHLYTMGLSNNPTCRKCGTEEKTSIRILCQALATIIHTYLGSSSLDREDINPLNAELNPICPLLSLFGAHYILHVSR
jgi:hypothetical protein